MSRIKRKPGWDAKVIHRIAKGPPYRGLQGLFERHGWPERGSKMMLTAPGHVKAEYGSIEAFERDHEAKP